MYSLHLHGSRLKTSKYATLDPKELFEQTTPRMFKRIAKFTPGPRDWKNKETKNEYITRSE